MKKFIIAAATLLVAQLVLAAVTQWSGRTDMSATPESPFLAFEADKIDGLEILGPDKERVVIDKKNGVWVLPALTNAPADSQMVTALIDKIAGLKEGFIVANSQEAAHRFKVADNAFERHLLLKESDQVVGDFFVGTSPAFRQVHARKMGNFNIVAVGLSTYELDTSADTWLDKGFLRVADKDLTGMTFPDFSLYRTTGKEGKVANGWELAGSDNPPVDNKSAGELVAAVTGITISSVIDLPKSKDLSFAQPDFSFTVTTTAQNTIQFAFVKIDETSFALKRSDKDLMATVGKATVERLQQFTRSKIAGSQPTAKPPVAVSNTTQAASSVPATAGASATGAGPVTPPESTGD